MALGVYTKSVTGNLFVITNGSYIQSHGTLFLDEKYKKGFREQPHRPI